jgi:type II secretory pathway component PulM
MNWLENPMLLAWRRLDSGRRRLLIISFGVLVAIGAVSLSFWLRNEHARLAQREVDVASDLKEIQADLAEIGRLKTRTPPPRLAGQALQESVVASLASQKLPLTVTALDAGRLRVQGVGEFDIVVRWLGNVQQTYRLALTSFSASRDQSTVTVNIVLTSTQE